MFTIQVHTQPKYSIGQKVLVENYMTRKMEEGTVVSLVPEVWKESTKWQYNVVLSPYDEGFSDELGDEDDYDDEDDFLTVWAEGKFQIYEEDELTSVAPETTTKDRNSEEK